MTTERAMFKRGSDLPHSKLDESAIVAIRNAANERTRLRKEITDRLSNKALAERFGVAERTIEKALSFETWIHVLE